MQHPQLAKEFIANKARMKWHDKALWYVRQKRDLAIKDLSQWEDLRQKASDIKSHTLANLDYYLSEFEKNALKKGIKVHWAKDAKEHNEIVLNILNQNEVKRVVKSKSMLTEECELNPFLEQNGIEVIDTDLGERIVQLRKEKPSHIVLPAIHLKKEDVGVTFEKFLGTKKGEYDPTYLTKEARKSLRELFLNAQGAITGVNFAIAQTGGVVVCTNEGNADLGVSLAKVHIASMGIEKVIPRLEDLGVFTRLLARSATGQPITTYTSLFHQPIKDATMHIVIVDNGRSDILAKEEFLDSLKCIRCGACINTCPIYRRSGGHSYGYTIPGPIGSTLASSRDLEAHKSLPFACTLCASCTNICPTKIKLHNQLYKHREETVKKDLVSFEKKMAIKISTWFMKHPKLFDLGGKTVRFLLKYLPDFIVYSRFNIWGKNREMPKVPKESFKELYQKRKKDVS
jgi:L-lactate dehydrogenase complex protein LldF